MAVRVRLFAALREAAGVGEETVAPGPLPVLLDGLRERHGEPFARVLAISSVLVDGSAVPRDAGLQVPDGAELALLPPVSGGAGSRQRVETLATLGPSAGEVSPFAVVTEPARPAPARGGMTVARALGSPTRAEIYSHLREAADERTVRDIAARFELHPNVARTHLELLADAGLVRVGRRKHPGGGRPAKVYTALDARADDEGSPQPLAASPAADHTLLVRLLAALLDPPGSDAAGRPVVGVARRTTVAERGREAAAAEGRRLVAALRDASDGHRGPLAPGEAAPVVLRALGPYAPGLHLVRTERDWVDVAGLRPAVAPLVGIRPELAEALERGLLGGAFAAAGAPVTVADADTLPGEPPAWRVAAAASAAARAAADPAERIDTRGSPREAGVVTAMRAVTRLRRGDVIEVLTEGAGSPAAFARWIDRAGHQLLGVERATEEGRPAIRLLIRKGG